MFRADPGVNFFYFLAMPTCWTVSGHKFSMRGTLSPIPPYPPPRGAMGSLTRFSGQFTCRHHAASAAAAGLLSYSTGLRSPIEV